MEEGEIRLGMNPKSTSFNGGHSLGGWWKMCMNLSTNPELVVLRAYSALTWSQNIFLPYHHPGQCAVPSIPSLC